MQNVNCQFTLQITKRGRITYMLTVGEASGNIVQRNSDTPQLEKAWLSSW